MLLLIYFREVDCSPFDIGLVYSTITRFADTDKFRFIQNIWKPDVGYEFPVLVVVSSLSLACVFEVRRWRFLFAACLLWYGVWKEWFQAGQPRFKRRTVDAFNWVEFNPSTLARRLKRTFDKSVFDELFVQARRAIRLLFVSVLYDALTTKRIRIKPRRNIVAQLTN